MTIRNYRQIAKTGSNIVAWGSGRSQVISPVRDKIVFKISRLDLGIVTESVTNYFDETLVLNISPVQRHFNIVESVAQYFDEDSEFV